MRANLDCDDGFQGFADDLFSSQTLELCQDIAADGEEMFPVGFDLLDAAGDEIGDAGEEGEMDAGLAAFDLR